MAPPGSESEYLEYVAAKVPWLRRVAFLLCQDWHRADDLVQSAITKLYVNWSRAAGVEHRDAYARTILVNCYLAEQRTSWWRRVLPRAEPDEQIADEVSAEPDPDLRLDLRAALAALPVGQRTALVLRFYCDLSVQETAELMSCSVGNIKSQTSRGMESLRQILDAEPELEPKGVRP
ncbi:MAG TPA: SigE family RNA polymerase sigma factor [Actinocrinis sp.]